jgi:multidrug resistance efflux pump
VTNTARVTATLALIAVMLVALTMPGCTREDLSSFRGVTEGEVIRLAAPVAGNLSSLDVMRGATVAEGTTLFSQADAAEISAHADAAKRLDDTQHVRGKRNASAADEIARLKAEVAQTQWKLLLKSASAPVGGVVTETLYSKGDWVPAGAPVLSILPIDRIKVNFEVPLAVAARLQNGRSVTLLCDRCGAPVRATITYVSPFATEASSSGESRELHYRVEARPLPDQATLLKPGQSITVNL